MGKKKLAQKAVQAAVGSAEEAQKVSRLAKTWNWICKNPKTSAVIGVGVGSQITDTNAVDFVMKGGKKVMNFKEDEGVLDQMGRTVTDNVTTEGTYDSTKQGVSNFFSGLFGGGGSGEGAEAGQGGGLASGLFNGIGNGLKNLMGGLMGGVTNMLSGKLPMLLMLPLAWLAFSKFGWLGKIGGLLLGVFAMSSLLGGSQQQTEGRQVTPQLSEGTAQQRFNEKREQQEQQDSEEQYTVHRH